MTLPGDLPPPLGHPPYAIMPYYLYTIVEKFRCTDISEASHAPPTSGGSRVGAKGADIFKKMGFLQSINITRISIQCACGRKHHVRFPAEIPGSSTHSTPVFTPDNPNGIKKPEPVIRIS
jgi:hypothetical protein